MENILQAQKKIDAVFAQNDEMAATIAQQPKEMGRLAVEAAVNILGKKSVPKFTPVPLKLVTQ